MSSSEKSVATNADNRHRLRERQYMKGSHMTELEGNANSSIPNSSSKKRRRGAPKDGRRNTKVTLYDRMVVLESREQLREIPEYMVPHGFVHTAEVFWKNMRFFFVSLDGEHFVGANADPSSWTPDHVADVLAGVGTPIQPATFTPGFLKLYTDLEGGSLKFAVTQHECEEEKKSR